MHWEQVVVVVVVVVDVLGKGRVKKKTQNWMASTNCVQDFKSWTVLCAAFLKQSGPNFQKPIIGLLQGTAENKDLLR